jgi:hypothetical protein
MPLENGRKKLVPAIALIPVVFFGVCAICAILLMEFEHNNPTECGKIAENFSKAIINTTSVGSLTGVYTCDFGELTEASKALQLFFLIPFCWLLQSIMTVALYTWRKTKLYQKNSWDFEIPMPIDLVSIEIERFALGVLSGSFFWKILDILDPSFHTPGSWWYIPGVVISIEANDGIVPWVGNFTNLRDHPQFLVLASFLLLYFGFPSPVCHRLGKLFYWNLSKTKVFPLVMRLFLRKQFRKIPELACARIPTLSGVLVFTALFALPVGVIGWLIQSINSTDVPFLSGLFDFSLTTRTAGFNSLDTGNLFWGANLLAWISMSVGTFPGGTGGRTVGPLTIIRLVEKVFSLEIMTTRAREFFQWRLPWVFVFLFAGFAGLVVFNDHSLTGWQLLFILKSMSSNVGLDISGTVQNFTNLQNIFGVIICSTGYLSIGGIFSLLHIRPERMLSDEDGGEFVIQLPKYLGGRKIKLRYGSELVN